MAIAMEIPENKMQALGDKFMRRMRVGISDVLEHGAADVADWWMRAMIEQGEGEGDMHPDKTLIDPYKLVSYEDRRSNWEKYMDYFLDDTVDADIVQLFKAVHYYVDGTPTDDAVEHALFLDPPEYKYEYSETKWQKAIDTEIIDNKMYFITDREQRKGFVLEYNGGGLDSVVRYPETYKLNGRNDDETDILDEMYHDVIIQRIVSRDDSVADTIVMKVDNKGGEWELYNEIEGWEALHEVDAYYDELGRSVVDQWESFHGGLKVLYKVREENVLHLVTSIEGEGEDAVRRGYAIKRITDDNGVEIMTAYKYHEDGVAVLLDRMQQGRELVAYWHPDNEEVKLYMVTDDELEAELRKFSRELALDYYYFDESDSPDLDESDFPDLVAPPHFTGSNWNERNEGPTTTETETEERFFNSECSVCLEKFKEKEKVSKWRCGHGVCLKCAAEMEKRRWKRCTTCRRSKTAREVEYTGDLSCFIPSGAAASSGAAAVGHFGCPLHKYTKLDCIECVLFFERREKDATSAAAAVAEQEEEEESKCDRCGSREGVIGGGANDDFINLCKRCFDKDAVRSKNI